MTRYLIAVICSFALSVALICLILPLLKKLKAGQNILRYIAEHSTKQGTPTMGGIAFVIAIAVIAMLFVKLSNVTAVLTIAVVVGYCIIGFLDDYIKIKYKHNEGLKPYQKILFQSIIAIVVAVFVYYQPAIGGQLYIPIVDININIGWWIIPLVIIIFLSVTNGVNLTDGLDGLATFTTIAYLMGIIAVLYNQLWYLDSIGDTIGYDQLQDMIMIAVIGIGALLAFGLFNCFPAKVFMGDSGSLALGALVACISIFGRVSLIIPILGIMYVVSCVSVIVQVAYFKISKGKRIFLMAPYHHHLQHKGLSETRIVAIYTVITIFAGLILTMGG